MPRMIMATPVSNSDESRSKQDLFCTRRSHFVFPLIDEIVLKKILISRKSRLYSAF
ncbi:MAG: hypothetical protein HYY44_08510 [Deltaproteobacteria bacterium]|nr:hypothetical protein [Deltaproteobacteria bacterium]